MSQTPCVGEHATAANARSLKSAHWRWLRPKWNFKENEQALQFDLSNAAAGIYFLRIVYGGFEKALRIEMVE